ncbi:MAG: carbohydrate-binding domain-containing protein [Lachnospiraceae bacterium]|nr:carbohydrate-binding domain-containing protein [Lachnospiraceae bacterium]
MSTHKNFNKICVVITVMAIVFTILFMNGEKLGLKSVIDEDAEAYEDSAYFTTNDQNGSWDDTDATKVTLNGDTCKISGNGAYVNGNQVVISGGGKYVISGTWDDGSIVVDAYESSKVFIKLTGVNIYCSDDACFRVNQADKVFLTLDEDTENTFESGEEYSDEALEDGTGGVIFAHDDLSINGYGSLNITANYKHGIDANDDLMIYNCKLSISAPKDGIHVNDSVRICAKEIAIDADDDGIATVNEGGYVYIAGCIDINSKDDGIHAAGDVIVDGGEFSIYAGDDGIHSDTNVTVNDGYIDIPQCYEGIEAVTIDILGGEIWIYPTDDGINANGGSGDMFGMQGGMDGQGMNMGGPGGDFNPGNMTDQSTSSETEGDTDNSGGQTDDIMADGQQSENAADNSSSDSSQESESGMPGQMNGDMQPPDMKGMENTSGENTSGREVSTEANVNTSDNNISFDTTENSEENGDTTEAEETYINISGGKLTIINNEGQDADGLDSNGDIYINGGEVYVSLTGNGTNNAIDYASENNGICEINGGIVVACGGSGMVEEISDTSAQCSILYNFSEAVEEGTYVVLKYANGGGEVISYEVPCSFSSICLSSPYIEKDYTYTLVMGDTEEEITVESVAGTYGTAISNMGGMGGMQGGGMRGGMQDGGMRGGRMFDQNDSSTNAQSDDAGTQASTNEQNDANTQDSAREQTDASTQDSAREQTDAGIQDSTSEQNTGMQDRAGGTPPGMNENGDFTPPDMSGNDGGNFQPGQNMNDQNASTEEASEDDTATYSSQKEVTNDELLWLGAAAGVLMLGLLIALLYKRW